MPSPDDDRSNRYRMLSSFLAHQSSIALYGPLCLGELLIRRLKKLTDATYVTAELTIWNMPEAARLNEAALMLDLTIETGAKSRILAAIDVQTDLNRSTSTLIESVWLPTAGKDKKPRIKLPISKNLGKRLQRHLEAFWPKISPVDGRLLFPDRNGVSSTNREVIAEIRALTQRHIPWNRRQIRWAIAEIVIASSPGPSSDGKHP